MLLLAKKIVILLISLFIFSNLQAQVEINKSVIFNSPYDSLRQIKGLAYPADSSALVNFTSGSTETIISFYALGNGAYTANEPFSGFNLIPGTQIHLILQNTNISNPTITIAGTVYPILHADSTQIRIGSLLGGTAIRAVYDGQVFRLTQTFLQPCPPNFISINDNYCIEKNERTATIYTTALTNCSNIGAHLCSWGEWYYACSNWPALGLIGMQGNWEFIDESSDHSNTYSIVGVGGCTGFNTENLDAFNRNYRCCFRKY